MNHRTRLPTLLNGSTATVSASAREESPGATAWPRGAQTFLPAPGRHAEAVSCTGVSVPWAPGPLLHLLGLDHEKLTYRYSGRDFRLTDVARHVIKDILA